MPCGCSDNTLLNNNKKFDNNKILNDNKILSLDSMAYMSIDKIVSLYKDGYRLEETIDTIPIESLQTYYTDCVPGTQTTDIYNPLSQVGGIIIYRGTVGACKIMPTSRCLDTILFYSSRRYSTSYSLNIEIRENDPATNLPKGIPGNATGLIKEVNTTFDTSMGYNSVTLQAELPTTGVPYWVTIRSSDYVCGGGTTGYERVELSFSWIAGANRAYYGPVVPCAWNTPASNDSWAMEVFKMTYNPPVFTTITIAPSPASINIGYTQQFTATCLDQNSNPLSCPTLTWTSSNTTVASINSLTGLATGGSAGTTNITCSGGGKTSNISILTVVAVVGSITISPAPVSLNIGATQQLTAVCKDLTNTNVITCPPLTWYTSNSSIATVSQTGLVTAVAPGTANISCAG